MEGHKKRKSFTPARGHAVHGVLFVLTALVGAQTYLSNGFVHRGARSAVAINAAASPAAMFDSTGILGVGGASVLLVIWLQRQASRRCDNLARVAEPLRCAPVPVAADRFISRRILGCMRVGGRHGP